MIGCVYGYEFKHGADVLMSIEESKALKRRYLLEKPVEAMFHTDAGDLVCRSEENFIFDGRSGGRLLDFYAPNLGSLDERVAWWMHDLLGYGQSLGFKDTNRMLRCFLRDICGYRKPKAWLIEKAVGLSDSWYGWPEDGDWCTFNKGRVSTRWITK